MRDIKRLILTLTLLKYQTMAIGQILSNMPIFLPVTKSQRSQNTVTRDITDKKEPNSIWGSKERGLDLTSIVRVSKLLQQKGQVTRLELLRLAAASGGLNTFSREPGFVYLKTQADNYFLVLFGV